MRDIRKYLQFSVMWFYACTYDSTPPDESKINDGKPMILIDATGFSPQRLVRVQYTDSVGSATIETVSERTDASGRFLYPLILTRGTRSYSVTLTVDQSGDGAVTNGVGDRKYQLTGSFASDSEIRKLLLTNSADFSAN